MQLAALTTLSTILIVCMPACEAPAPATTIATSPATATASAPLTGPPPTTAPAPGDERFHGEVQERLAAGPYTYLRVATPAGPRWVVTMGAAPDGVVEVRNMGTHRNFHARRLGRDFEELVFGIVSAAKTPTHQL